MNPCVARRGLFLVIAVSARERTSQSLDGRSSALHSLSTSSPSGSTNSRHLVLRGERVGGYCTIGRTLKPSLSRPRLFNKSCGCPKTSAIVVGCADNSARCVRCGVVVRLVVWWLKNSLTSKPKAMYTRSPAERSESSSVSLKLRVL